MEIDAFRFLIEKPPSTRELKETRTLFKKGFIYWLKTHAMNEREISLVLEWNSFVNNKNYNLIEKCLKLAQILEYPRVRCIKGNRKDQRIRYDVSEIGLQNQKILHM